MNDSTNKLTIRDRILLRFLDLNYIVDETRLEKLENFLEKNPESDLDSAIYKIYEKRYSHSKLEKFRNCPKQYEFYYKLYIRSIKTASPLFFGSALDAAFNCLLLRKKAGNSVAEQEFSQRNPIVVFDETLRNVEINYEKVEDFPTSELVDYFSTDFAPELRLEKGKLPEIPRILTNKDLSEIYTFAETLGYNLRNDETSLDDSSTGIEKLAAFCEKVRPKKKEKPVVGSEKRIFNFICWKSLRRKGRILIRAYIREIYPEIAEVFAVQKKILIPEICTETGKKTARFIQGEIDAVVRFHGETIQRVLDNKSSATKFKAGDILEKWQLPIYCFHEHLTHAAYAVVEKKLRKREPRHRTQILKGPVSVDEQVEILEQFLERVLEIENGEFPENRDGCLQFGRMCDYSGICKYGLEVEDCKDLVKLYD